MPWASHLQDVYDAKVQDHILGLCRRLIISWECSGNHMHSQLHPLLSHAVTDLICCTRAECHWPALESCTFRLKPKT